MRARTWLVTAAVVGGCHASPGQSSQPGDPDAALADEPPAIDALDLRDDDADGIADALEDALVARVAPELRLPPDDIDGTRPSTVEWYLERVALQFDHGACPDDSTDVLEVGAITAANLPTQMHYLKDFGTGLCKHESDPSALRLASDYRLEFYLSPEDEQTVYAGIPATRANEWRVYAHVTPSTFVRGDGHAAAYDVQVWYFFPYNDGFTAANHEGDWEHLTIAVDSDLAPVSVYMASHGGGARFDDPSALSWVNDTHVVVYVADGSHATYESAGAHMGPVVEDHCYDGGPVWQTWQGFVNVGEAEHPRAGQDWLRYGGRWGKRGIVDVIQSGPPGPAFNGKWNPTAEY